MMRQQQKFRCFGDLAAVRASQGSKVLRQRFHQGRAAASSQVMATMESTRQNIQSDRSRFTSVADCGTSLLHPTFPAIARM